MVRTSRYESSVISFLCRHFHENYSINQLAKHIGLTPKGMHKLLKRLEKQDLIYPNKIGNGIFYQINFASDLAKKTLELALFEKIELPYAKVQAIDLERLRPFANAAILFGSVLEKGEKAGDIDVLFIIERKNYKALSKAINELQQIKTKPIHSVLQTSEDLINNLKKRDKVILEILKKGKILFGHEIIVNAVRKQYDTS